MTCPFCLPEDILFSNEFAYARYDRFPVSSGHILIIPYRHTKLYFDLVRDERIAIIDLLDRSKHFLDEKFKPDGYNIGINVGECSGQTILHVHNHLIPRYVNDVPDPRGGIRGIIPDKKLY